MQQTPAEITEVIALLEESPYQLSALTRGLDDSLMQLKPDLDSWSVNEILSHLRACADVWGKSIVAMASQDHPTLRYISPRTRMRKVDYSALPFDTSLQAFTEQRNELLVLLKGLENEDWSRGATFTGTVRRREQTILDYAQRIVGHERPHVEQIEAVLKEIQI